MKSFSDFHVDWIKACEKNQGLLSTLQAKVPTLLLHPDESYVRQGINILISLDGLPFVLEKKNGEVEISNKYSENRMVVEKCIIEEVVQPQSKWFGLYDSGGFDKMYSRTVENVEWGALSESVQQILLSDVKPMVDIPDKKYSIGKYLVTQALWESVMGNNPSCFRGASRPVELVNWLDSVVFCNQLSEKEGLDKVYTFPDGMESILINKTGLVQNRWIYHEEIEVSQNLNANGYRLPTDWEWYFAAKANQDFKYAGGDNLDEIAWTKQNSTGRTHGVGQKKPNGFGLYDMTGNVCEWCWDWFEGKEDHIPVEGSTGPVRGVSGRVCRSGSWGDKSWWLLIPSYRRDAGSIRFNYRGFRVCRTIR